MFLKDIKSELARKRSHHADIQSGNVHPGYIELIGDQNELIAPLESGDVVTVYINGQLFRAQTVRSTGKFHVTCSKITR